VALDVIKGIKNFFLSPNGVLIIPRALRSNEAVWWHEYFIPATSFSPGASGATWTPPDANTVGGYQLDAAGEVLYYESHVEPDWDGASDLKFELYFEVNVDNSGGNVEDTVDIKLVCYYKGNGETSCKTQTIEVATTVGQSPQYKQFKAEFAIDWDAVDNVIEVADIFGFILNLETDTSEVDNIIINYGELKYHTKYPAPEV